MSHWNLLCVPPVVCDEQYFYAHVRKWAHTRKAWEYVNEMAALQSKATVRIQLNTLFFCGYLALAKTFMRIYSQ
jgi:hypothetical protein